MLILDALFILALVSVLNQGEEPEFFKAFLVGLGLAVAGFVAVLGLTANCTSRRDPARPSQVGPGRRIFPV
jgi:hypothetical protein